MRSSLRSCALPALYLLVAGVMLPWPAEAQASQRDILLMARAAGFMEPRPSRDAEFGIVYPGGSAPGRAEAEALAVAAGAGVRVGALTLRPRLVPVADVARSDLRVLLLTEAARPDAAVIAAATAGRQVLTVSVGMAASGSGTVVMSIVSEPQIEIVVNRAAALAAGVTFSPAFRMLIRER